MPAVLLLAVGGREGREQVESEGSRLSTDAAKGSLQRRSGPAPPTTRDRGRERRDRAAASSIELPAACRAIDEVDPGSLKTQSLCCELQRAQATSQSQMQTRQQSQARWAVHQRPRTCAPSPTPRPVPNTHVRFSSLMELRMKAGFRAREICVMSCSSAGHRAGWAGPKQVLVPHPPLPFCGQTWSCALTPLSLEGTSASHSLQGLFIAEYNWPLGEQWAWNAEGSPLLWAWPPILPGKLSIFLYFPPRALKHKHPCPVCCVSTSQSVSSCMPAGAADNHLLQNPYPRFTDEAHLAKRAESGHFPGFDSLKEER